MKKKFQKAFNMIASLLACVNLTSPIQAKDTNCYKSNSVSFDNSTKRSKRKHPFPIFYADQSFLSGVVSKVTGTNQKPELVRLKSENFFLIKKRLKKKIQFVPYEQYENLEKYEYIDLIVTESDANLIREELEEILSERKTRIQTKISNTRN